MSQPTLTVDHAETTNSHCIELSGLRVGFDGVEIIGYKTLVLFFKEQPVASVSGELFDEFENHEYVKKERILLNK